LRVHLEPDVAEWGGKSMEAPMNRYLAAAALLLASAGAASAQTIIPCINTDPMADTTGECGAAPITVPGQSAPGAAAQGATSSGLDNPIDSGTTSAIPQPATPQGMPPLVVPNDPLGQGIDQNPFGSQNSIGGSSGGINGNGAISGPAIR
jgi:hypothetical protein